MGRVFGKGILTYTFPFIGGRPVGVLAGGGVGTERFRVGPGKGGAGWPTFLWAATFSARFLFPQLHILLTLDGCFVFGHLMRLCQKDFVFFYKRTNGTTNEKFWRRQASRPRILNPKDFPNSKFLDP